MIQEKEQFSDKAVLPLMKFHGWDIIWAEDLFDVIIVPYTGSLKKKNIYRRIKNRLTSFGLVVVDHYDQSVIIVECKADTDDNRLYIAKDIFDKHWRHIRRSIAFSMRSHDLPESPEACIDRSLIKTKIKPTASSVDPSERRKQSLLDNPDLLFYYSDMSKILHDKDCPDLSHIPTEDLMAAELPPEGFFYCPHCVYRLYSRVSCFPVSRDLDAVEYFVRKHYIGKELWLHYVEDDGVKINVLSKSSYKVKCHEDSWEIRIDTDGSLNLWHNNYVRTDDGDRYLTGGFHDQGIKSRNLKTILDLIVRYDWRSFHKDQEAVSMQQEQEREDMRMP